MTEQRTELMSDERLKEIEEDSQIAPIGELIAEVKRLRSLPRDTSAEEIALCKAENVRLRQVNERFKDMNLKLISRMFEQERENERLTKQLEIVDNLEAAIPHHDTILLDKLERKIKGGWRVKIDVSDHQMEWLFKLTLRGAHGETEEFEGPTLRSVAALEEK